MLRIDTRLCLVLLTLAYAGVIESFVQAATNRESTQPREAAQTARHAPPKRHSIAGATIGSDDSPAKSIGDVTRPGPRKRQNGNVSIRNVGHGADATGKATGAATSQALPCHVPDQQFHFGWSMIHSDADFNSVAAVSFEASDVSQIEIIRWWGAYEDVFGGRECATIPKNDMFSITIHHDAGGQPGGIFHVVSPPSPIERTATGNEIQLVGIHSEYLYSVTLAKPLQLSAGETYWLSIVHAAEDLCAWSWETAEHSPARQAVWDTGTGFTEYPFGLGFCLTTPADCNENGIDDILDIGAGSSADCQPNGMPDECEADCNGNDSPDACDIRDEISFDCDADGIPDDCMLPLGACMDTNCNGQADWCEPLFYFDCNDNNIYDQCDISCGEPGGFCDVEGCGSETDCNRNCVPDRCETAPTASAPGGLCDDKSCRPDGNENGIPDECEDGCLSDHADGDIDCDADLRDYLLMQRCFTGTLGPVAPAGYDTREDFPDACDCFDQDFDGDVDKDDLIVLRPEFNQFDPICSYCPDVWSTSLGQAVSYYDFSHTPLPAGFFGDNSEPFAGILELKGVRSEPPDPAFFDAPEQWDTRIVHPQPQFDPDLFPCHQYVTVPIRPDGLRLTGKSPLLLGSQPASGDCNENGCDDLEETAADCDVTACGCATDTNSDGVPDVCQSWLAEVSLSFADSQPGKMFIRTTHFNGGYFSTDFTLQPRFTFYLLHDLQQQKPASEVRTVTMDTGLQGLPGLSMSFEDVPWSREVDDSFGLFAMNCAQGNFIAGIDTGQPPVQSAASSLSSSSLGYNFPETTCTSHINEGEEHHFCPGECNPEPSCHYVGAAPDAIPPNTCHCESFKHRLPDDIWLEECEEGEMCAEVTAPLTYQCDAHSLCRRLYGLSHDEPCSHPPHCP